MNAMSMALFNATPAFLGLDIGTSTLKVVELLNRKKRLEVTTYAHASLPNLLIDTKVSTDEAIQRTATVIAQLLEKAHITTDAVITALPSSIVFSTVLMLPDLPEAEMDKAVHFAARDVVPTSLDEMVLGWSRLGEQPHMDPPIKSNPDPILAVGAAAAPPVAANTQVKLPVFVTAAPKTVVERYTQLLEAAHLQLRALEVETFALIRSLLTQPTQAALIIDCGDKVTTFHVVDRGTARITHTLEFGGHTLTATIAEVLAVAPAIAEKNKIEFGLHESAPPAVREALITALSPLVQAAQRLQATYLKETQRPVKKVVLIGGGANLRGLATLLTTQLNAEVTVGNPWRGLAYPQELEARLRELGPEYAVAVGLALRGFTPA